MIKLLKKAEFLNAQINSLKPFSPDLLKSIQEKLRIEWTYNSIAIEGNTLTLGETAFFLREGLTSEGKPLKDYLEAKNHAEAIDLLMEFIKSERELSESFIKELHSLLLRGIDHTYAKGAEGGLIQKSLTPGKYKTMSNHVLTLSGNVHYYAEPLQVPGEIEKLIKWHSSIKNIHPIEKAATFHYHFTAIHPFDDGNGRMARLLLNLILIKAGYPPCVIRNERRRSYLESLEHTDQTGEMSKFIEFTAQEVISTEESIIQSVSPGQKQSTQHYTSINAAARKKLILQNLTHSPVSIGELHLLLPQIKRPTLKVDLQNLVKDKKVIKEGEGRNCLYHTAFYERGLRTGENGIDKKKMTRRGGGMRG
jgi:Fic family protein